MTTTDIDAHIQDIRGINAVHHYIRNEYQIVMKVIYAEISINLYARKDILSMFLKENKFSKFFIHLQSTG